MKRTASFKKYFSLAAAVGWARQNLLSIALMNITSFSDEAIFQKNLLSLFWFSIKQLVDSGNRSNYRRLHVIFLFFPFLSLSLCDFYLTIMVWK